MRTIEIGVGDIVQLKSGGPKMVVDKINYASDLTIGCIWFNKTDELKCAWFSIESLNVIT